MPKAFIACLVVFVLAAGGALFGFDLLPSPPPQGATHLVKTNAPDKLSRRVADRWAMQQEGKPGTLTPLYPDNPGGKQIRTVTPANPATRAETQNASQTKPAETTGAAPSEAAPSDNETAKASAAPKAELAAPAKAEPPAATKAEPITSAKVEPAPQAQSAAQPTAGHCDVAACTAAYHSFRASDCSYQPYEGPRRACVAPPPAQRSAGRGKDRNPAPTETRAAVRQHALPDQDDDDDNDAVDADDVDTPDDSPASIVVIQRPRW